MKAVILIFILLFSKFTYSQNTVKFPISVKGEIFEKGSFRKGIYTKEYKNCYKARLEIINNEDTVLPISFMTCSWAGSWNTDNDSIYVLPPLACLANYPTIEEIPPGQSLVFYADLYVNPKVKKLSFKIGFTNYLEDFIYATNILDISEKKGKTFWSDEIQIENSAGEYFIH